MSTQFRITSDISASLIPLCGVAIRRILSRVIFALRFPLHNVNVFQQLVHRSISLKGVSHRGVDYHAPSVLCRLHYPRSFQATDDADCSKGGYRTRAILVVCRGLSHALEDRKRDGLSASALPNGCIRSFCNWLMPSISSTPPHRRTYPRGSRSLQLVFHRWGSYTDWASQISFEVSCPRLFQQRGGFVVPSSIAQIFSFEGRI
jgi:hypothetical protein